MGWVLFFLGMRLLGQDIDPGIKPVPQYWPPPSFSQARILLVGVDVYQYAKSQGSISSRGTIANLPGAKKDVEDFEKLFHDFISSTGPIDIKVKALKGNSVTKEGLLKAITDLKDPCPTGLFFIFWAGHAMLDASNDQMPYLLLHHTDPNRLKDTGLSFRELLNLISDPGIDANQRMVVLDVCHSGGLMKSMQNVSGQNQNAMSILLAGTLEQSSQETPNGGVFSQGLLRGLRGFGKGPVAGDFVITLQDAYSHARSEVEMLSPTQTPTIFSSNPDIELINWGDACTYFMNQMVKLDYPRNHRGHRDLKIQIQWLDSNILQRWQVRIGLKQTQGRFKETLLLDQDPNSPNAAPIGTLTIPGFYLGPGVYRFDLSLTLIPKGIANPRPKDLFFFECPQFIKVF